MNFKLLILLNVFLICVVNKINCYIYKEPSVFIISLIRNKAHVLPYFLSYLENLKYPKNRISLWIRSDHNQDNSIEIIKTWLNTNQTNDYNEINFKYEEKPEIRPNETSAYDWPPERFHSIIRLKEEGFDYARKAYADYVLFLDADVLLTNPNTLIDLINTETAIVSPMVLSDGLYSNFWAGMDEDYYYKRTEEYKEILEFTKTGVFSVPMIHSVVLVNLNLKASDYLTFNKTKLNNNFLNSQPYDGPLDDIITFAISANYSNLPLHISNSANYGYLLTPLDKEDGLYKDKLQLTNINTLIINYDETGLLVNNNLRQYVEYPAKDKLSLSKIFMINLDRRPEKRIKMELNCNEIGIETEHFSAVDGKNLSDEDLIKMNITFLSNYADPFHKRPMTKGEVGCFLSHYKIWERMVEENLEEVLILEDDIKFEPYFKPRALNLINEARELGGWDLIYFGRKRLQESDEPYVENTSNFVKAGYSYWTLAYLISLNGAKKLLDAKPLEKLIPVDEFLPIMFNQHPNKDWKFAYPVRNLNVYSLSPLIIFPTHYTGEDGYLSDTEDSSTIKLNDEEPDENAQKKGDKEQIFELTANLNEASDILINTINENIGVKEVRTEL